MDAKEFLNQVYNLDQRVKSKLRRLEEVRSLAERVTVSYGAERVSLSRNTGQLEDAVIRIAEAEHDADEAIDCYVDARKKVTDIIDMVRNPKYRELLELRYLQFMTWERIAEEMWYTKRWVYRMHGIALKIVDKLLQEEYT
jgi:hypothetical protein